MSNSQSITDLRWYAVQTLSNMEGKAKQYLNKFTEFEEMGDYIQEVLVPTEVVSEIKNGKKTTRNRKFYPGYIFVKMRLYDETNKILQKPWYLVNEVQGIIGFVGGEKPVPLKPSEIDRIIHQVQESQGKEKPKVQFEAGEVIKINEGPFVNLNGEIDDIDIDRGKLKVSVSIFGRLTPVELEFWQVDKVSEEE